MKAYLFRHQHGGFDCSRVFLSAPTDEQMAAVNAHFDAKHGPGWALAVSVEVIDGSDVPELDPVEERVVGQDGYGRAAVEFVTSGVGHVEEVAP